MQLVPQGVQLSFEQLTLLLARLEGHLEVTPVALDENEFFACSLQFVSDLRQGLLGFKGHVSASALNRLILPQFLF